MGFWWGWMGVMIDMRAVQVYADIIVTITSAFVVQSVRLETKIPWCDVMGRLGGGYGAL